MLSEKFSFQFRCIAFVALASLLLAAAPLMLSPPAMAQDGAGPSGMEVEEGDATDGGDTRANSNQGTPNIKFFPLLLAGGFFMIPIFLLLVLVIAFAIERGLGLRRSKVMPHELVDSLGQLAMTPGGFDPRKAYRLCQQHPSAASNVIRSMLLKVGRPHQEVEHTVSEASDREAGRMYRNVGWLTLAAAVAPLMGLLGTVWGMIKAFHKTTTMPAGSNMALELGEGIYTALVTTLAGLSVAIPAAVLAHFFESRIKAVFHEIDELLFSLLPQIERYEGRLRVSQQSLGEAPPASSTAEGGDQPPVEAELAGEAASQ